MLQKVLLFFLKDIFQFRFFDRGLGYLYGKKPCRELISFFICYKAARGNSRMNKWKEEVKFTL